MFPRRRGCRLLRRAVQRARSLRAAGADAPVSSAVSRYRYRNDTARWRNPPSGSGDGRVSGKAAKDRCANSAKAVPFGTRIIPATLAGMCRRCRERQRQDGRGNSYGSMHVSPRIPRALRMSCCRPCSPGRPEPLRQWLIAPAVGFDAGFGSCTARRRKYAGESAAAPFPRSRKPSADMCNNDG